MPEYIMPDSIRAADLDAVTLGFIEAGLFSDTGGGLAPDHDAGFFDPEYQDELERSGASGPVPGDACPDDLHPAALDRIKAFCAEFQTRAADLIREACNRSGYDLQRVGNDLYFTHAGHGVGFWDRPELKAGDLGHRLTAAAGRGEANFSAFQSPEAPRGFWVDVWL